LARAHIFSHINFTYSLSFLKFIKVYNSEAKRLPAKCNLWKALRYYKRWKQYTSGLDDEKLPGIPFELVDLLITYLSHDAKVFEYGIGKSTFFWAKHAKQVVSVEYNLQWAERIEQELQKANIRNVTIFKILPQSRKDNNEADVSDPAEFAAEDDRMKGLSFERFVKKISDFPDGYFDLVFIDAKARASCIVAAMPKIKVHGLIVLDNSERGYYFWKTSQLMPPEKWLKKEICGPSPNTQYFKQAAIFERLV
jgi:hypothetical protein